MKMQSMELESKTPVMKSSKRSLMLQVIRSSSLKISVLFESVTELRKRRHNLPGMSVLHFGFDDENEDNPTARKSVQIEWSPCIRIYDNDTTMCLGGGCG